MMALAYKAWRWLSAEPHQKSGVRVLQVAVGSMLAFRVCTEFRFASYLWGPTGLGWGTPAHFLGARAGTYLGSIFSTDEGTHLCLGVLLLAAIGLILGIRPRLSTALALCTFFLLGERLPELN